MPVIDVLAWELVANTKGLIAGVGKSQAALKGLSKGAGATVGAVAALGAAMVVAGARAAKMAADLDQALAKVSTLLPETTAELGDLREQIVALSTRVPQTPVQLTEALYQAISSGARDTAEALFLVEQAAKASVAGQTDIEGSLKAIASVINAYNLDISEATRVSDVFFKTVDRGVLEFSDIAATIGDVAGTAALAGISIEEVGAALATMTLNGVSAAEATTSLNRFLLAAITPTDDLAQTAAQLGVDLSAAGLQANGLVGIMQQMEEAAGGDIETLAKLNPEIRAARAAFVLAGKGADDFREILDDIRQSGGKTEEAFQKMAQTAGQLTQQIQNKLNAAFYELGEPILRQLVIPSLQFINALLPELGENSLDFAERIRQINNELGKLERFGLLLKGLFTDDLVKGINVIGFGGTFEEAFPNINRALFAEQADELAVGITDDFVNAVERIPDLVKRRGVLQAAFDEIARQLGDASSDAAGRVLQGQLQTIREALRVLDRQIAARDSGEVAGKAIGEGIADGIGESVDVVEQAIRDLIQRAGGTATDELVDLVSRGLEGLSLPAGVRADFEEFTDTAKLNQFRREIERIADEFDHAGERALAVEGALQEWGLELDDLPPVLRMIVSGMTDVGEVSDRTREEVRGIVQEIGTAARATAELAEAFGLVGDGAGQVVSQLDLIAQGVSGVIDGLQSGASFGSLLGPIGTAVGGVAGLLGTVLSGPSPEEQARRQSQEQNTRALQRLSSDIDRLRTAMFDLPGAMSAELGAALDTGLEGARPFDLTTVFGDADQLRQSLEDAGLSISEIERIAQTLGLDVDQLTRLMEGQRLKAAEAREALEQAQALQEGLAQDTLDYFDTVAGRLEQAQRRIDVFDITDPLAQIDEFVKVLEDAGVNLSQQDLDRLRQGDDELIQELIEEAETGTGRFAGGLAAFGEFTRQEFLDLLVDVEGIGDRIQDATGEITNYFDTVAGRLEIAQRRIQRFDIEDPLDQIAEFVNVLEDSGLQLTAAEQERLRSGDEDFINALIDQLEQSTGRFASDEALGDFTRSELIDILSTIEGIGDQIEAPGGGREGFTESFQTFNRVTAVQGSAMIAQLGSANFFLRQIAENTAAWLSIFGSNQIQPVSAPTVPGAQLVQPVGGTLNSVVSADSAIGAELDALRVGNGLPNVRF